MRKRYRSPSIYDAVAANIKKYRLAIGISLQVLAERTCYSHEYIRRIESPNRRGDFTIESVYIIAKKGLGIPVSLLFEIKKSQTQCYLHIDSLSNSIE